jgi:outer membrane protein assembly factor BamD
MRFRRLLLVALSAALAFGALAASAQQQPPSQSSQLSPVQRLDILRSRLETLRRTLNSAISGLNTNSNDAGKGASADDPRVRLSGLEKETNKLLGEVSDLHAKQDRSERYDTSEIDKLETALTDLDARVQTAMRDTASDRRAAASAPAAQSAAPKETIARKKSGGFFSRIIPFHGGSGNKEYDELVGTVAPGRDRQLFQEATKEARKDNYETSRSLYAVIINTYPDSPYLPLAKLAIADTFYLEGTTSALIQAGQAYQEWITFFPTHALSDDVCLKMGEVEMRRMGLADRDISPARKAEQRLKVCLQQFPKSSLRPDIEVRLREVQENLADHDKDVGDQYFNRYYQHRATNLKGAQSRYLEVVKDYPFYSKMAEVLYRLGTTYIEEEEPDEATKYLQQLVREHPNCDYAEQAKEKLTAIGAAVPDPDPSAANQPCEPPGPGFFGGIMQQISGVTPKTVEKDGVIISRSSKGGSDIIDAVIQNNGTLPDNFNKSVQRTPPARDVRPLPSTQTKPAATTRTPATPSPSASPSSTTGAKP